MRWIFFVLLAANVILLGWQLLAGGSDTPGSSVAPQPADAAPTIRLLRETGENYPGVRRGQTQAQASERASSAAPPAETESVAASEAANDDATNEPTLRQPLCTFVGPFPSRSEADQLAERIIAMDVPAEVVDVEIPAGPGYWVYVEPLESRREALQRLADLQARGIDSYIIPKGELMNGISLGMFSKEPLAKARLQEVRELGVEADIDVIERTFKEIWLSIPEVYARRLGDQAWQRLLEEKKSVDRRQNFCLHVASQDNFH